MKLVEYSPSKNMIKLKHMIIQSKSVLRVKLNVFTNSTNYTKLIIDEFNSIGMNNA